MIRCTAVVTLLAAAGAAHALVNEAGSITLFGQEYTIQRFDYSMEVSFPDPLAPAFDLQLIEVEGAHFVPGSTGAGNPTLLLGSNEFFKQSSYKDMILEVAVLTDVDGNVTGFEFVDLRMIADAQLPAEPGLTVLPWDLDIGGVTTYSGINGFVAPGDLLVSDTEEEQVYGIEAATGDLVEGPMPPCADEFCGFEINPFSYDPEGLTYVPALDEIWVLDQDDVFSPNFAIARFDSMGLPIEPTSSARIPIADVMNPEAGFGEPKGLEYVSDTLAMPALFQGVGGVVLVCYDDSEAGLHAIDTTGAEVAYEPLTDDELDAYIAMSESSVGRVLNRALFAGFNAMYDKLSYALGLAAAQQMQQQDL
jgi:hypothetical protein